MKVCKTCKHEKKYHGIFGCIVIVERFGLYMEVPVPCDCFGWNKPAPEKMLYRVIFEK